MYEAVLKNQAYEIKKAFVDKRFFDFQFKN